MIELIRSLFEMEDSAMYNEDYYYKTMGVSIFEKVTKDVNQIDLIDFLQYFKDCELIEYIEKILREIKTEYIYLSSIHGIKHNTRVLLYSLFIAYNLNLKNEDIEVLVNAALYHDIGRVNDKEDDSHGLRSAQSIEKIMTDSYADINILKAIIELHSIDDKNFERIAQKYNITDNNRLKILYSILKDADALDRVRLSYYNSNYSELNPNMLRLPISYKLLKVAHQLHEYFIKNSKKRNIILDTDIENEIDDKFALTYLLQNLWMFNLDAITIAPFYGSKYSIIKDNHINNIHVGVDASYNTSLKIMDMVGVDYKDKVFKGSIGTISNGYHDYNDAVNKIVEVCLKNDKTDILCIGALTNIALAIRKNPDIVHKTNIIWLGGNDFMYDNNDEFNFRQDIQAVKEVFSSGVDLTLIPCINVGSILVTTGAELKAMLSDKGEVGQYLYDEFCRCKKEKLGKSKTIWDLSVIAYLINGGWFEERKMDRPDILENGNYIFNKSNTEINVVTRISRDAIFRDFFGKVSTIEYRKEYEKVKKLKK